MSIIESLIQFKSGEKAVASEVNKNFEDLRVSNNEHSRRLEDIDLKFDKTGGKLNGALILNDTETVNCESSSLFLNSKTNSFKVLGTTKISEFIGIDEGIVILLFENSRILENNNSIKLQNNVDRITKSGDCGIYLIENGVATELNYFSAKEIHTNSFMPQTILDCPKNKNGRADFIRNIEFDKNYMPIMEADESDDCAITCSSIHSATYNPWYAFRHHTNDAYGWLTLNGVATGWLKIEFRKARPKFKAFCINARNSADASTHCPCDFIIEGSNDDTNWTLLGQYVDNLNWVQNERRYFGLSYFDNFKYYKITITKNSGIGAYVGFGALEFFEAKNDYMPLVAELDFSADKPLLLNNSLGLSTSGKVNQLSAISSKYSIENLNNNSLNFIALERQKDNRFNHVVTTAQPVYTNKLQKHSVRNSIPTMISTTTSIEFKYGYSVSASSYHTTYYPFLAFNHNWENKWLASVAGGNQWIQFDFPNYRTAARFSIVASADQPAGCVKNGFIKGFNGEEWVILKEIKDQVGWAANEVRNFDVDIFEECMQFKLEITDIETPTLNAQIAQFEMFELAHCFVIPENRFYKFDVEKNDYEATEINFIGRIKTQHNFITDSECYAIEHKYQSEEIDLKAATTFAINHNTGLDYKNLKISAWVKDKIDGFVMPWEVNSILDASHEYNNNGFYYDDCLFYVRTGTGLMQFKDYNAVNKTLKDRCSLIIQLERNF